MMVQTEKEAAELAASLPRVPKGGVVEKNLLANIDRVEALHVEQVRRRDDARTDARGLSIRPGALARPCDSH